MSIIETLFKCNSDTTIKHNTRLSFTERFKSCMFTNSNKQNAETKVTDQEKGIDGTPVKYSSSEYFANATISGSTTEQKGTVAPLQTLLDVVLESTDDSRECNVANRNGVERAGFPQEEVVGDRLNSVDGSRRSLPKEVVTDPEKGMVVTSAKFSVDIISPTHHDTLFWCMYIAAFGYNDYLQIGRNYGVKELEIKKLVGESIQSYPAQLKQTNYKITKASVQEIMSDCLTCQTETSMLCLIAIICYFKMNVIMVDSTNKCMLEFISLPQITLPTYVLYKDAYGKYKIKTTPIFQDDIASMKKSMICLENYLKPLKPISIYKIDDLIQIAKIIGIYDETEKRKKPELYEQISNMIMWR